MTERARDTGDELVLYDDQRELVRVTRPTRMLGAALGGVHVLDDGLLIAVGARYGKQMVTADSALAPLDATTHVGAS